MERYPRIPIYLKEANKFNNNKKSLNSVEFKKADKAVHRLYVHFSGMQNMITIKKRCKNMIIFC